jgi:hypothetical protein
MTFIQPWLLYALPLAALPVIIHLIHLYRRRQVKWAAMMFLLMAQRMNKGLSRLRQILILTLRVLAVAAVIFAVTRPLAGGWLGLTGGAPDTVMVLLDRSASMEQQNLATGVSKRAAGLRNVAKAINDAVGDAIAPGADRQRAGEAAGNPKGGRSARSSADRGNRDGS